MDWFIALAVFVSYVIKGMFGFANSLVFGAMLGFRMDNAQITPIDFGLSYPATLFMLWKFRRGIQWRVALPLGALVAAGTLPGMLLLQNMDARFIRVIFGLVVTASGLELLLRKDGGGEGRMNPAASVAISLISGVTCGMFNVGALIAAYLCRQSADQARFKANISFIFALQGTVRLAIYLVTGMFSWSAAKFALTLMPILALGLWAGLWLSRRAGDRVVRACVLVTLIVSGLALSAKGIVSLL